MYYILTKRKLNIANYSLSSCFSLIMLVFLFFNSNTLLSKDTLDVLRPEISKNSHCGNFLVNVSDNRSFNLDESKFHLDLGITSAPILYPQFSENFSEIYSSTFETGKINFDFSFRLSVTDPYKDAKAVFVVTDMAGNFTFDSVVYKSEKLMVTPGHLGFGSVFVGQSAELSAQVLNVSNSSVFIRSIFLKRNELFKLNQNITNFNLDKDSSLKIIVNYFPIKDNYDLLPGDIDTLVVETNCLRYTIAVSGQGVVPKIYADDFDFGAIEIGTESCTSADDGRGLRISNGGTGKLFVNGYYQLSDGSNFYVKASTNPNLNDLEINPNNEKFITGICFFPQSIGEFIEPLIFKNNASGPDSIAYLRGIAYLPGPYLSSHSFGRVRVGEVKKEFIIVRNSGSEPVEILDFQIIQQSSDFRIIKSESIPQNFVNVTLYPQTPEYSGFLHEIKLMVEYNPNVEYYKEAKIQPVFAESSKYKTGTVFNYVRGFAYLPKIQADGLNFDGRTLVNVPHEDTLELEIRSVSLSSDLLIKKVNFIPVFPTGKDDFLVIGKQLRDTLVKSGNSIKIPISFIPRDAGERVFRVEILSDAYSEPNAFKVDTNVVYIKGNGFNRILSIEPYIFDDVKHCAVHNGHLQIKNISDSAEAFIITSYLSNGDINAFKLNIDSIENNFVVIKPQESISIPITFEPENFDRDFFECLVKVISDVDTGTGLIKGTTIKTPVSIFLPQIEELAPGSILDYNPPENYDKDFDIFADFTKVDLEDIKSVKVTIKYNKSELEFRNKVKMGDLIEGWNYLSANVIELDKKYNLLEITASGPSSVSGLSGILFKPVFMILLSDSNFIYIELINSIISDFDNCFDKSMRDGKLALSYCGDEVRKIVISKHMYNLRNVTQSLSRGNENEIMFSIPFESYTNVVLFDSYGSIVKTIYDGMCRPGEYYQIIDTSILSSGSYYIRMSSGPFSKTIPLMIVK